MTLFGRLASISTTRGATQDCRHGLGVTLLVGLVVVAQLWGCGKRGRPLAPFIRVPALVTDLEVRRLADEVSVSFTLPTQNRDGSEPADLARVDVYAMTTQPRIPADRTLDIEEFEESATLVASIEVRPRQEPTTAADPADEVSVDPRPEQGFPVAISEPLVAATLVPVDPWEDEREEDEDEDDDEEDEEDARRVMVPLMTPLLPGPLQREYVVVGVSSTGREAEAQRIAVPLVRLPAPPAAPVVTYTEDVIDITWELPLGARAAVQVSSPSPSELAAGATGGAASSATATLNPPSSTATPQTATGPPATTSAQTPLTSLADTPALPILVSRPVAEWPPASRYDLYEIVASQDEFQTMPQLLNMTPLTTLAYADRRVEFGLEHCYAVRTLDVVGGLDVRSGLSAQTCVTLVDTFPPAAPQGLTAVGSEGAVSLIWQPNDEEDVVGYLVLRGLPPGETLQPLISEPVQGNTYRDTTAEPGVGYVYAVRAVDTATPPNLSPLSNQAGDTAR